MAKGLTARQGECLDFIGQYIRTHSRPPTMREIGEEMGIRSTNGVTDHLRALERKGFIVREPLMSRGIRICDPTHDVLVVEERHRVLAAEALRKAHDGTADDFLELHELVALGIATRESLD